MQVLAKIDISDSNKWSSSSNKCVPEIRKLVKSAHDNNFTIYSSAGEIATLFIINNT